MDLNMKTKYIRRIHVLSLMALCGVSASIPQGVVQAQTRPVALETRLTKAVSTYNDAIGVMRRYNVFQVYGKVEEGNANRISVYGTSTGYGVTSEKALGWNTKDSFLIVQNPPANSVTYGKFNGVCIALSQREFAPVPADYITASATADKYGKIIISLRQEITNRDNLKVQASRKIEETKNAKAVQSLDAKRDSVYRARVVMADKEVQALLASSSAAKTDKSTPVDSAAAMVALYNKWGALGVDNQVLLKHFYNDFVSAMTLLLEQDQWEPTISSAKLLLSLEASHTLPVDAETGRERFALLLGEMPSSTVTTILRPDEETEPAAVSALAKLWLEKLPTYLDSAAPQEKKIEMAKISQFLGAYLFSLKSNRSQTIARAVDQVRGAYGPSALDVLPLFQDDVAEAKKVRVARQVESFSAAREEATAEKNASVSSTPNQKPPVETSKAVKETPPVPALDFTIRSFVDAKKSRLSDYKEKTVLLYFWDTLYEEHDTDPKRGERLFSFSQRYDPNKLVLLLVDRAGLNNYNVQQFQKLIKPTEGNSPHSRRPRLYPKEVFGLEVKGEDRAVREEEIFTLYIGNKNPNFGKKRVTVINPDGQIVGSVDFKQDETASSFNFSNQKGGSESYNVYDFDEDALENLVVRAMKPGEK